MSGTRVPPSNTLYFPARHGPAGRWLPTRAAADEGTISRNAEARHPRTAIGLSADRRFLFLMAIDGRQPQSTGALDYETGAWMLLVGAADAATAGATEAAAVASPVTGGAGGVFHADSGGYHFPSEASHQPGSSGWRSIGPRGIPPTPLPSTSARCRGRPERETAASRADTTRGTSVGIAMTSPVGRSAGRPVAREHLVGGREGVDDGLDLVRVDAPHARVAQLARGAVRGRRQAFAVAELGDHAVRRRLAVGVGGGRHLQLGAQHQRVLELALGRHGRRGNRAAVGRDEVHQPETQAFHLYQRGDVEHLFQRRMCLDQHMNRNMAGDAGRRQLEGEPGRPLAIAAHPNITAIDLALVMQTIDNVTSKVSFVIEFMALFTVATGIIVLAGSVLTGRFRRAKLSEPRNLLRS